MRVLDFHDHALPPASPLPQLPLGDDNLSALADHYSKFVQANALVTQLAIPSPQSPRDKEGDDHSKALFE